MIKPNGGKGKCKTESIDSSIPKKSKQVGFSDKQCAYVRSMVGHTNHTTLATVISSIPTVLLSKGVRSKEAHKEMDMQTSTIQIRENVKGQILLS
jgi:hypothetical protein